MTTIKPWKIYSAAITLAIAFIFCVGGISNPGQLTQYFYNGCPDMASSNDVNAILGATNAATLVTVESARTHAIGTNTPSLLNVLAIGRNANNISITNLADATTPQGAATLYQITNAIESARIAADATNASHLANIGVAGFVGTNAATVKLVLNDGSSLTNLAADARKQNTNAVLDKLLLVDGSSLTNLAADVRKQGTNAILDKLLLVDGSSLTNVNPAYYTGSFPVLTTAVLSAVLNFTNGALKYLSAP
jgi:hypothetical protein